MSQTDSSPLLNSCVFVYSRRIALKVSATALRSVVPDEQEINREAELSASDSEGDDNSDSEGASAAFHADSADVGSATLGSLSDSQTTAREARRVFAAAIKQQRSRRAAPAVGEADFAQITAVTTAKLESSPDSSDCLTWRASGAIPNEEAFLIFSGTFILRNAIWCAPLESFDTTRNRRRSSLTPSVPIAARPLASLFKVLQHLNSENVECLSDFSGSYLTHIVVLSDEGMIVAGTSDGRVMFFPAEAPSACGVVGDHKALCRSASLMHLASEVP